MAENDNGKIPDDPGPNNIRIIIDFDTTTSQIMLGGPTDNLPLFLGLLETAKFVVMQQRVEASKKSSIIPGHTPFNPGMLRRH